MTKYLLLVVVLSVAIIHQAEAHDFATALETTTWNVPAGADIAAMGNADASAWGWSSNNPAMAAFTKTDNPSMCGASFNYGVINFNRGPDLSFYSVTGGVKIPIGFLQTTYSYFSSESDSTKIGVDIEFQPSKILELVWANKIHENLLFQNDELYFGIETAFSSSKMTFSLNDRNLSQIKSKGNMGILGFLYKPNRKINVGSYYARSWDKTREKDLILNTSESASSTSDQFRFGVSCQALPMTFFAIDYQFLNLDGKKENQVFAGIEQGVVKDFIYLYGGWANRGPTTGLGAYFKNGGLNFAYMKNPFDELRPYFGTADLFMGQIFFSF